MSSVLVGMFDSQGAAAQARNKLLGAGFSADSVMLTGGSESSESATSGMAPGKAEAPQHEGAMARFFSGIFGADDERGDDAETYREAFKRGSYGVSVNAANDDEAGAAEDILDDCGAVDIDEKAQAWRQEGWVGNAQAAAAVPVPSASQGASTSANVTPLEAGTTRKLQEVQEELKVGKRAVARGGVRVFTRLSEVPVEETVRLREERASVTRTAVDRPATAADLGAFTEGSIELRETGEEAVVSKSARVTGEVEVGTIATEREETIRDTVRKTQVDVEQIDDAGVAAKPVPRT